MKFTKCLNPSEVFLCVRNSNDFERNHGGMSGPNSECFDLRVSIRDRRNILCMTAGFPIGVLPFHIHARIRAGFTRQSNACQSVLTISRTMNPWNDAPGVVESQNLEKQKRLKI